MTEEIIYGKFWDRVGAYLLDTLIVGFVTFGLNYANILHFKSFWFYLPIAAIGILYKPYMESYYGATLGKMALNLKVTDLEYNQIDFKKSLLRSLIVMVPGLIYIPVYYLAFNNPAVTETDGFMNFATAMTNAYPAARISTNLLSLVFITDIIVLLTESGKKQRSLKDFIANTYVVKVKK
ncbi:RDD family protein [Muricauda sp. CAU 1633]|uniref:RDD family protein n=1 Tax=Allomuricauda sp. CAU 1633 TaxID=2816036 RepID=UPI001A8F647D|nr:RDD family protein [Muricauda sp. CAU 1633]MBO0321763.1 RDD family protein [Muricauda sp. CAU 1633]